MIIFCFFLLTLLLHLHLARVLAPAHGCRGLSARADLTLRRRAGGLRAPDTGLPPAAPNTDMALYRCGGGDFHPCLALWGRLLLWIFL